MKSCCDEYTKLTPASPRQRHKFCPHCGTKLERSCFFCGKPVRLQEATVCYTVGPDLYAHTACTEKMIALAKKTKTISENKGREEAGG